MLGPLRSGASPRIISIRLLCTILSQQKKSPSKLSKKTSSKSSAPKKERSFVINSFIGELDTSEVFPYPTTLNQPQSNAIQNLIKTMEHFFTETYDAGKCEMERKIPDEIIKSLWSTGVFNLLTPEKFGGMGMTNSQHAQAYQLVGKHDLSLAILISAHQCLGIKGLLLFGNEEQKEKYLAQACEGKLTAFCLTEKGAGSDAGAIQSRAVLSDDGEHYILNGSKIWISNGCSAELMTVFAKVGAESEDKTATMTAFIVERFLSGITSSKADDKMGLNATETCTLHFEDVKIPVGNVLGGVGNGFKIAMKVMNSSRAAMAACLSGTMFACIEKAIKFVQEREQFGNKLQFYQGIQEKIAKMAMLQYVSESMAFMITGNLDRGSNHYQNEAAIAKCFASEAAWYICDECIQIMGGAGYMKENGLERVMRDLRVFRIFESTNDILRIFVALNGIRFTTMQHQDGDHNMIFLLNFIGQNMGTKVGLPTYPNFDRLVHPELVTSSRLIAEVICLQSMYVQNVIWRYGSHIIDQQSILNRIADNVFAIYGSVVALSRATSSLHGNVPTAAHECMMTKAFCFNSYHSVMNNLRCIECKEHHTNFELMAKIGQKVCNVSSVPSTPPLDT